MTIERVANTDYFLDAKSRWYNTPPIRGRATDVRPLGDRRRDWEQVVKIDEDTYAYRHHATNVITFHADGRIVYDSGGYITKTTREFMNRWFYPHVSRSDNKYWVLAGSKAYPVSASTPLTLRQYDGQWVADEREIKRHSLDRDKMRQIRKDIKGFTKDTETLLKITDGWLHSSTFEELGTRISSYGHVSYFEFTFSKPVGDIALRNFWVKNPVQRQYAENMVEIMKSGSEEEQMKLRLMLLQYMDKCGLDVRGDSWRWRVSIETFRASMSKLLRGLDVYKVERVEDSCYARNLIV